MKRKPLLWLIIIPLVLIVAFVGGSLVFFGFFYHDTNDFPYSNWQPEKGIFHFTPETILDSLKSGMADVFTPDSKQVGESSQIVTDGLVEWIQGDYLVIAEAVNQKVWGDSLSGWEIYRMDFSIDCHDNPQGFEEGRIVYFKTDINNTDRYIIREFLIRPKYGIVEWGGGAHGSRPLFGEWKSVDTNRMLDAEDGLKIAEENGGKDVRIKFDNNCSILLDLVPETYEVWDIEYLDNGLPQFGITINPFIGKILRTWRY